MYEAYWGLKRKPFENTPDPEFLYHSSQHEEALARLLYAVTERKGAAILTGVFGCGKTVLGQTLLKELSEDRYRIAFINYPMLSHLEFLLAVAKSLGASDLPTNRQEVLVNLVLDKLNNTLLNNVRDGKDSIVIIDEAHIIEDALIFESLRLLLNFQLPDRFLLTLLLVGQPELKGKIDRVPQLKQRLSIRYHLQNLDFQETQEYIRHRCRVAGREDAPFSDTSIGLIYSASSGIPREINNICDLCLVIGMGEKVTLINEEIASQVVRDMKPEMNLTNNLAKD